MSNVPGYLQKENSSQEKALNFGVLDWKLLAGWKYNEGIKCEEKGSSSQSCSSTDKRLESSFQGLSTSSSVSGKPPCSRDKWFISQWRNEERDKMLGGSVSLSAEDTSNALKRKEEGIQICSESSHISDSRFSELMAETGEPFFDSVSARRLCPSEFFADISYSCPLPSSFPTTASSSKGKCTLEDTRRASFSTDILDRGVSEQLNGRGNPPSPSRRFGFNIGKIGRSFSFRETSLRPETSSALKGNASRIRGKFSPLRRLFDPILKYKVTESTEEPVVGLDSKTLSSEGACISKPSISGAILQLLWKNGLPFFKLVDENSGEMLVADLKQGDYCTSYAFYRIPKTKSKSKSKSKSWFLSQGSNSKSFNIVCNLIGHMKFSSTYLQPEVGYVSREFTLYNVKQDGTNDQEVAAVVVETKSDHEMPNERDTNALVVILPGGAGVHTIPTEGKASSLVSRWRSGGSCDCGGWDIGCKLRVLTNRDIGDHVNVYDQGEWSKLVLAMKPQGEGSWSIQLDSSVSMLEALATCSAYITCKKLCYILEVGVEKSSRISSSFEEQVPVKYMVCPPSSPVARI